MSVKLVSKNSCGLQPNRRIAITLERLFFLTTRFVANMVEGCKDANKSKRAQTNGLLAERSSVLDQIEDMHAL